MNTKKTLKLGTNDGYYLPLFNLKGLKSSITPFFGGDLKTDYHHYALQPTTDIDLYNNIFSRNVIFDIQGKYYFLNGQTSFQKNDRLEYESDLLFQKVTRSNRRFSIVTTSYIPTDTNVELHEIQFMNISTQAISLQITTAVPIYGRSADNLRDHRHVTSLLNQINVYDQGICVKPTLSFDERGHQINQTVYSVLANSSDMHIVGYIPVLETFVNGGSLHFPKGLKKIVPAGTIVEGYEAMGGIQFEKVVVQPHQTITFYLSIGIHQNMDQAIIESTPYLNRNQFHQSLKHTNQFFLDYVQKLSFSMVDQKTILQLNWAVLQPMLRRYFGNSYLPHHDYGRGGRGWRDLWQDLLALIMMHDNTVYDLLLDNFQGVRIDGSNATIIGDQRGEFKADRNMITRVWSDHGAWPLLTVKMYIDETGDLEFLLKKQFYFADQFTHFTKQTQAIPHSHILQTQSNEPYRGSILEHLLLQNLVGHHNIGEHGFVKLEDADWNDGLDMAHERGETIAFTHMYARNLDILAHLVSNLPTSNVVLFEELLQLLEEDAQLSLYFDSVSHFKGNQIWIDKHILAKKLEKCAKIRIKHLHQQAFRNGNFQSYFNNDGLDLDQENTIALTGQAIALLSQTATKTQAKQIARTTKKMLYDKTIGGYKLNSNYHQLLTNMGRAYGFAYGHKENGAVFSHMVMMYAYGLYQYDLVKVGREALFTLLNQAQQPKSHVLHGIPEYFTDQGIGKYPYLTGSASWLLKLLRTEIFGLHFELGKLTLRPKLRTQDFIDHQASIQTYIFKHIRKVTYINPKNLDFGAYSISKIMINNQNVQNGFLELDGDIEVYLDELL